MNAKTVWKKMRDRAGFTLVELIVVIAILGILGGVAVPVYNGYIKKAEAAADAALLSEVNTAFAAACLANGEDNHNRTDAKLTLNEGMVASVTSNEDIQESFDTLYDSEDVAFQGQYKFEYDKLLGMFEMITTRTANVDGVDYEVAQASVDAYRNSIFNNTERGLGTEFLLDSVDDLVGHVRDQLGLDPMNIEGFEDYYTNTLGLDIDDANATSKLNALVLYTAKNSKNLNGDAFYQNGFNYAGYSEEEKVAGMALEYAVGLAFVQDMKTQGKTDYADITTSNMNAVTGAMRGADYEAWFATNGKATIDGYLGAMDMIADNTDKIDTWSAAYLGFGELESIITGVLEQTK